jgi:hypothetical protein
MNWSGPGGAENGQLTQSKESDRLEKFALNRFEGAVNASQTSAISSGTLRRKSEPRSKRTPLRRTVLKDL